MLTVDNIEIKIKTYDRKKNQVILNLIILDQLQIRGFIVRYTTTKFSPIYPIWVVTPPSVKGRNKAWFHIVRFTDSALWQQLQKAIVDAANEHANSLK